MDTNEIMEILEELLDITVEYQELIDELSEEVELAAQTPIEVLRTIRGERGERFMRAPRFGRARRFGRAMRSGRGRRALRGEGLRAQRGLRGRLYDIED